MQNPYTEILLSYVIWTVLAGVCLGIIFSVWRMLVAAFSGSLHRIAKKRRLRESKKFHLTLVK